jgi:ABC-type transport system involved in multi-copper enzyme maturation permease subunit
MRRRIAVIALNTFREAVRDRVLYNLILFAFLLMGTAILFGQISVGVQKLILVNLGLAAITFFGLAIAIFIGIGLVYKEMEQRTLYALLSKPVTRAEFILGKFCGLGLTLAINTALMTLGFLAALYYVKGQVEPGDPYLLVAIYLIFLALLLATAWALLFSCFSSPVLSAVFTAGLFIAGSLSGDLRELIQMVEAEWLRPLLTAVYYVLPNFANFNVTTAVAHGQPIPLRVVGLSTAYGLVYTALVVGASVVVFQRRNLK